MAESLAVLLLSLLGMVFICMYTASSTSYSRGLFSANENGSSTGQSSASRLVARDEGSENVTGRVKTYEHLKFVILISVPPPVFFLPISFLPLFPLILVLM